MSPGSQHIPVASGAYQQHYSRTPRLTEDHELASRDPLQEIPGVGPSISADLRALDIERVADLEGRDPEQLYQRLCVLQGGPVDRCMLYVFRCAVYYATEERHDPDLLLWWSWKDHTELDGKDGGGRM